MDGYLILMDRLDRYVHVHSYGSCGRHRLIGEAAVYPHVRYAKVEKHKCTRICDVNKDQQSHLVNRVCAACGYAVPAYALVKLMAQAGWKLVKWGNAMDAPRPIGALGGG